jgi:hypothetical protein
MNRFAPVLAFLALAAPALAQRTPELAGPAIFAPEALRVVAISPSPEALDAARDATVTITFNKPIDTSTLDPATFNVLGRWSGPVSGSYVLLDSRTVAFVRDRDFSAAERVFVSLSRDLRAADGARLPRGYAAGFWVLPAPGSMSFTQTATLIPGDVPYGAHGGDLDDDGDLDLAIPNEESSDVSVFLNGGGGTFGPKSSYGVGFHCSPSEGLDLSGDGVVDLAVSNILDHDVSILIGNGDGTFQPQVRYPVGTQPRGLVAMDVDTDGDADLITANRTGNSCSILRNRGDGTFDPATPLEAGVTGETGVAAADLNLDGVMDLVVIGWGNSRIATLLGNGRGGFALHSVVVTSSRPWMVTTGDLNGDGFPDAAAACSGSGRAGIYFGDGAIDIGDLEGDGDLDMVTSSYSSGDFHVYTNNGAGNFTMSFTIPSLVAGSCAVLHDRDNDGDTDLTLIDELGDRLLLYTQQ